MGRESTAVIPANCTEPEGDRKVMGCVADWYPRLHRILADNNYLARAFYPSGPRPSTEAQRGGLHDHSDTLEFCRQNRLA